MWLKFVCLFVVVQNVFSQTTKPNIIVIVADDLGFNDVGFHGSDQIPTPNIDALAYNGVILNNHYTQALCTPSRSAFLTGKYPIHLGMQHLLIQETEPWGLPLNETVLPEYLKRNGYQTHAVGKWHLGFYKKEYTPTFRGFDSHFGYYQGFQDYYTHDVLATFTTDIMGYDMRRNLTVDWEAKGSYSTTLFEEEAVRLIRNHDVSRPMFMYLAHLAPHTGNEIDPLQAPDEEIAKFAYIDDPERRVYAAMVSMMDKSVGSVLQALKEKHMLENSIVVFMSDNGAPSYGVHANHGSNYPFRGQKNSAWEGAMRGVAAIWSPLIKKPQRVTNQFMHISDWLPTLYSAAGLNQSELPNSLDGKDLWPSISEEVPSPRTDLVYNIDDQWKFGAIREGDWKYLYGSSSKGKYDSWYGVTGRDPQYHYDVEKVLESKAATTLAGFLTFQQIKEMEQNRQMGRENLTDFTVNLINAETINTTRASAIVTCKGKSTESIPGGNKCDPMNSPCLFNLREDPCETTNLATQQPGIKMHLEQALLRIRKTLLPIRNKPADPEALPSKHNFIWVMWGDCEEVIIQKIPAQRLAPWVIGLVAVICIGLCGVSFLLILMGIKRRSRRSSHRMSIQQLSNGPKISNASSTGKFFEDRELQMRQSLKDEMRTLE